MTLEAQLRVQRPGFALGLELTVAQTEVVALLGPNGAGKTTALSALAGLVQLTAGRIRLADEVLEDPEAGIWVPPEGRPVGVVFQDYRLFPHLSALDNVAFGLRAGGRSRAAARRAASGWLDRLGLSEQAGRRPRELSGGQAQRVALARALAVSPRLLLLDEPLAALDAATRLAVRVDLRRHLDEAGIATLLVTHDPLEAMVLADRLVVLEAGRVVQQGGPAEVARRPRTAYVARLVGLNLYRGTASGAGIDLVGGGRLVPAEPAAGPVLVAVPPSAVSLHAERPQGSPRNVWPGRVEGVELVGDRARVQVAGEPPVLADVTPAAVAELRLGTGTPVWAAVKATELRVYAS